MDFRGLGSGLGRIVLVVAFCDLSDRGLDLGGDCLRGDDHLLVGVGLSERLVAVCHAIKIVYHDWAREVTLAYTESSTYTLNTSSTVLVCARLTRGACCDCVDHKPV